MRCQLLFDFVDILDSLNRVSRGPVLFDRAIHSIQFSTYSSTSRYIPPTNTNEGVPSLLSSCNACLLSDEQVVTVSFLMLLAQRI